MEANRLSYHRSSLRGRIRFLSFIFQFKLFLSKKKNVGDKQCYLTGRYFFIYDQIAITVMMKNDER